MILEQVLEGLMRRYRERVPDVAAILDTMVREGLIRNAGEIENDHIAFRSLGVPHLGIASLEKIFLHLGYVRRDPYYFAAKKLDAFWYAPPEPHLPRIFLSELRVSDLPERAQRESRRRPSRSRRHRRGRRRRWSSCLRICRNRQPTNLDRKSVV